MRRALALSWALGTSTGVLLGLFGVQLVTSGITGGRIAPLSRPEVLQALSAGNTSEASEAAPATTAPPAPPDIGSAPPLPDPVSKPAPKPPASAPPRPGATAGTTTTTAPPPPPPPTTAPPPPAVATPDPPAPKPEPTTTTTVERGETRTISSRGGSVAVRYLNDEVRLLWARPNSGYDVTVVDDGPDKVSVRFRGSGSQSLVYAYYKDGEPTEEVVERGNSKDDRRVDSQSEPVRQSSGEDIERWREYWER